MRNSNAQLIIYDCYYDEIDVQDFPREGCVLVCKSPNDGYSSIWWCVLKITWNDKGVSPNALGVFMEKKYALFFANALLDIAHEDVSGLAKRGDVIYG